MIYFAPTVRALQAHIDDLQNRVSTLETEKAHLLDRLLMRNNYSPIQEPVAPAPASPALQYIAPQGMALPEIQDAVRDVWIHEEAEHLMTTLGYDEHRAWSQATENYTQQHRAI